MSHAKYKKLSFFTALTMLIGSVVGIGIFFKNNSIFNATDGSGWGTLLAWVIGGLLSLATALPYIEIGTLKSTDVDGIPNWAEKSVGKTFGYFIRFNFAFFYLAVLISILSFFLAESIINVYAIAFDKSHPSVLITFIISLVFVIIIMTISYISLNTAAWIQKIATVLKFIPLFLVVILGIAMFKTNNISSTVDKPFQGINLFGSNSGNFSFTNVLIALPMVLFSFDSFLNVGSLSSKTKGEGKTVSLVIIVGMLFILALYLLISIAQILHGSGTVIDLFNQVFDKNILKTIGTITMIFITISVYGVINAISVALISIYDQNVKSNTYWGSKKLKTKYGQNKTTIFYLFISLLFWELFILIALIFLKSDAFVDGISNLPTLIFFAIYSIIIFGYTKKRTSFNTKKMSNWLYYLAAAISVIGVFLLVGYQLVYVFIIHSIIDPSYTLPFGLFNTPTPLENWQFVIVVAVWLVLFIGLPLLNKFLNKNK